MKKFLLLLLMISVVSCKKNVGKIDEIFKNDATELVGLIDNSQPIINKEKNTIKERFSAPKNFEWEKTPPNSYGQSDQPVLNNSQGHFPTDLFHFKTRIVFF